MRSVCLALVLAILPGIAVGAPVEVAHQARVLDGGGAPLNGSHDVHVSLYTAPTGGTPVWTDTFEASLSEGYLSLSLGSGAVLDDTVFNGAPLFLGVRVDAGVELSPRARVGHVPYAAHARSADTAASADTAQSADTAASAQTAETADTAVNLQGGTVDATSVSVGSSTLGAGGLSIGGTPVFDASGRLVVPPADLGCSSGQLLVWNDGAGAWSCGDEADPAFAASAASDVAAADIGQWNSAYSWGDHAGQYLPVTGGTVSGPVTSGPLTVSKQGDASVITFPATVNDPGSIRHVEDNNTGILWLTSSDDWDAAASNDHIIMGDYATDTRRHVFTANGSASHSGSLTVQGETLTAARIASWDRPSTGCPSGMDRIKAWCVDDTKRSPLNHVDSMRACWGDGLQLCDPQVYFACDDSGTSACNTAMDSGTQDWLWTAQMSTNVNDVAWTTGSGEAMVTASTGNDTGNEIDWHSRANSYSFFCCRSPTN